MTPPDACERKALRNLEHVEWENAAQLYVEIGTKNKAPSEGWIEQLSDSLTGVERFRITDEGRAALRTPQAARPRHPKLKTLPPLLKTLDTHIARPVKRPAAEMMRAGAVASFEPSACVLRAR
jgi:hypothetical protein